MTPQEREVITSIFDRLKSAATQARDPEAERLIADLVRQQPYAPYALAQSVYVQEQALNNMQAELQRLQGQVAQLQQQAQQQQQQSGGFLSGLFGGGRPQPAAPQPGPWSRQPQQGMPHQGMPMQPEAPAAGPWGRSAAPAGGSGFLGTALTTAAGVAGGMVVGNMLMNAFKGTGSSPTQSASSDFQPMSQNSASDQAMLAQAEAYDAGYEDGDTADLGGDSYDV